MPAASSDAAPQAAGGEWPEMVLNEPPATLEESDADTVMQTEP